MTAPDGGQKAAMEHVAESVASAPDSAELQPCGHRARWAIFAPSWMFRCGKPEHHDGYHGEWT